MRFDGSMARAFKGFIEVLGPAFLGYGLRKGEPEVVGGRRDKAGLCWA